MKLKYEEKYFEEFCKEFNKYADNVHEINLGASIKDITKAEFDLKVKFPKRYIEFLQICNGGYLYPPAGPLIFSVFTNIQDDKNVGCYLNYLRNAEEYTFCLNNDYLPIARTSYGDIICLDLVVKNIEEPPVITFDHELGEFDLSFDNIKEWLSNEMANCFCFKNYDGTDKEVSIDEIKKYIR